MLHKKVSAQVHNPKNEYEKHRGNHGKFHHSSTLVISNLSANLHGFSDPPERDPNIENMITLR
jgi:hypothetical protein